MREAFVSLVTVDGQTWWRSVAANPMADPVQVMAEARRVLDLAA